MEDLDDIQKIQEGLYEFPYHHIPKYDNKKFSTMRAYRGSHQYIAAINFLLSKINEIDFKNLLDIGCGDGKYLYEISKKYPSKLFVGIDYSEQAILFATAMSPKIKFICGDITKNTIGKFDLIILIETLEHIKPELIPNFMKFANECADVCKVASDATNQIDELFQFAFGGNAAEEMQKLLTDLDVMEDRCDETEIILRNELFKIEKDHPPINVMFLYSVINKIGELADTAETVGHRISLIASK